MLVLCSYLYLGLPSRLFPSASPHKNPVRISHMLFTDPAQCSPFTSSHNKIWWVYVMKFLTMYFSLFSRQFCPPPKHPDQEHLQSVLVMYPVRPQASVGLSWLMLLPVSLHALQKENATAPSASRTTVPRSFSRNWSLYRTPRPTEWVILGSMVSGLAAHTHTHTHTRTIYTQPLFYAFFCFNGPPKFTPLLDVRSLILGLTPFGCLLLR
jgi:hypothetical protein